MVEGKALADVVGVGHDALGVGCTNVAGNVDGLDHYTRTRSTARNLGGAK